MNSIDPHAETFQKHVTEIGDIKPMGASAVSAAVTSATGGGTASVHSAVVQVVCTNDLGRRIDLSDSDVLNQALNFKRDRDLYNDTNPDNHSDAVYAHVCLFDKISGDPEQVRRLLFAAPILENPGTDKDGNDRREKTDRTFDAIIKRARVENQPFLVEREKQTQFAVSGKAINEQITRARLEREAKEAQATQEAEFVKIVYADDDTSYDAIEARRRKDELKKQRELIDFLKPDAIPAKNTLVVMQKKDGINDIVSLFENESEDTTTLIRDDYLYEGWIRTEEVAVLTGPGAVGKSTLLAYAATQLANGDPFLDYHPCPVNAGNGWALGAATLIMSLEGENQTIRMLKSMRDKSAKKYCKGSINVGDSSCGDLFHYIDEVANKSVSFRDHGVYDVQKTKFFKYLVECHSRALADLQGIPGGFKLLIIDSLSRLISAIPNFDENSSSDMTAVFEILEAIAKEFHIAIVVIHHAAKDNPTSARGSGAITTSTRNLMTIVKSEKPDEEGLHTYTLVSVKLNDGMDYKCGFRIIGEVNTKIVNERGQHPFQTYVRTLNTAEATKLANTLDEKAQKAHDAKMKKQAAEAEKNAKAEAAAKAKAEKEQKKSVDLYAEMSSDLDKRKNWTTLVIDTLKAHAAETPTGLSFTRLYKHVKALAKETLNMSVPDENTAKMVLKEWTDDPASMPNGIAYEMVKQNQVTDIKFQAWKYVGGFMPKT